MGVNLVTEGKIVPKGFKTSLTVSDVPADWWLDITDYQGPRSEGICYCAAEQEPEQGTCVVMGLIGAEPL